MDIDPAALRIGAIQFIIVVCSLALHEWGHAVVADKLGDDTPRREGRVTLNPLAHIDPIGTIVIPLLGALGFFGGFAMIGWAKPVYIDPSSFRRGQFDQALVTLAGPGMNLALALLATLAAAVCAHVARPAVELFSWAISINVALFVFNMLPVPPLDGSKFYMYWFGMSEDTYVRISTFGSFGLLLLINVEAFRDLIGLVINFATTPFVLLFRLLT
jgi:Zn-dependent protease